MARGRFVKILFWLHVVTVVPLVILSPGDMSFTVLNLLSWFATALWCVAMVSFYAVAYAKRIGTRPFWKIAFFANLLAVFYGFGVVLYFAVDYLAKDPQAAELSGRAAIIFWSILGGLAVPLSVWILLMPVIALAIYVFRRPAIWNGQVVEAI